MPDKINILAICGSTRKASSNLSLLKAIDGLATGDFNVSIYEGLTALPYFNPDEDTEAVAPEVADFRLRVRAADAVIICTPEYAIGVPGTLKNALDWAVSNATFSGKPVALITASLSGAKAHQSLLGTLLILEARMTAHSQLLIPFVKTKVNDTPAITDAATLGAVQQLIASLKELVLVEDAALLSAPLLLNDGVNSGMH